MTVRDYFGNKSVCGLNNQFCFNPSDSSRKVYNATEILQKANIGGDITTSWGAVLNGQSGVLIRTDQGSVFVATNGQLFQKSKPEDPLFKAIPQITLDGLKFETDFSIPGATQPLTPSGDASDASVVSSGISPENLKAIQQKYGLSDIQLTALDPNTPVNQTNDGPSLYPASLIKPIVADVALKALQEKGISLDSKIEIPAEIQAEGGKIIGMTYREAIKESLSRSSNTGNNALIYAIGKLYGGETPEAAQAKFQDLIAKAGYSKTSGAGYLQLESPIGNLPKNKSTLADINEAMRRLQFGSGAGYDEAQNALKAGDADQQFKPDPSSGFSLEASKAGFKSDVLGYSAVVTDKEGKKYLLSAHKQMNGSEQYANSDNPVQKAMREALSEIKPT